jgi:Flp pilus assembly protein TadB
MSLIIAAGLWAGVGLGLMITAAGITGRQLFTERPTLEHSTLRREDLIRVSGAVTFALIVAVVTGWLAAGLLVALGVLALPRILGGRAARDSAIARTEAIAAWTEMIRDSIIAASGLEEAIVATGPVAPAPIGAEVRTLVLRLERQSLPDALLAFQADVKHPSADMVVAALVIASRMEASDLSSLLSRLADAIRDDARMRIRVEVGRTRVRTAAKVIVGVVASTVVMLAVTNREYLGVYDDPAGQIVLLMVGAIFAVGAWLLDRMADVELPERFNARSSNSSGAVPW